MLACVNENASDPYRVAPPQPPDPYLAAWADLRRRRIAARVSAASSLLGCAFAFRLPIQLVYVVLVVMAAALVATFRHTTFPCPRCSEFFSPWRRSPTRCVHCGIAVGTPAPSPSDVRGE
jgi:hypothetical protein